MLVGNTTVLRPRPKLRTRSPVPLDTVDLTDTTELPELVEPSPPILQVEEQPHAAACDLVADETCSGQMRVDARLAVCTQDFAENPEAELVWNTAWTLSIGGGALYPIALTLDYGVAAFCWTPMGRSLLTLRQ